MENIERAQLLGMMTKGIQMYQEGIALTREALTKICDEFSRQLCARVDGRVFCINGEKYRVVDVKASVEELWGNFAGINLTVTFLMDDIAERSYSGYTDAEKKILREFVPICKELLSGHAGSGRKMALLYSADRLQSGWGPLGLNHLKNKLKVKKDLSWQFSFDEILECKGKLPRLSMNPTKPNDDITI